MGTFLLGLLVTLLAFGGLALGVMLGRPPIRGSCGGLACIRGADCAGCPERRARGQQP
ncbi:MAG TPA: (Na+)-NQR maturation NqrM [Amaricoccus sp.]|uniref:(Na+)-NQR maturation NqrM n=1 Tax=Amaricoccus sp. TaxID=1872485 RepID=UPI001DC917B8|nr:(Na+)-NQR maturation NqrM [Amaricoccus sp.]MCB1371439.1 (Na+)-NQR maturation NqrM [Paracoccaceae bacterium]MCC0066156.1 (Na+)-NQR maturation NqrM [Rhodovulum sp.]MCB1403963.1 (Na+)-NQR maturation NqrM [Paracoccaceae bacterium]HPG22672.1 (Na+)-NQR maturation NqrM [Amaricoccus sp.]HRW16845.1 (Na+)-NQR maturation NqrM [Amaricoccus sp.]